MQKTSADMLYYKKSEQMAFKKKNPRRLEISLVIKQPVNYERAFSSSSHLVKRMGVHSHSSKESAGKKGPQHDQ